MTTSEQNERLRSALREAIDIARRREHGEFPPGDADRLLELARLAGVGPAAALTPSEVEGTIQT